MVPLSVSARENRGAEYLDTWFNGKKYRIKSPIKPYFYSYKKDLNTGKKSKVEAVALSCNKKKTFYKYEFNTRAELVKARNDFTFEDNIAFVLRNRIDDPNLYTKHPHTDKLKFLFLDIEQYCPEDKPFPSYDDIITAISYCTNDREIKTGSLKKETMSDKKLLQWFIKGYEKVNPDVIVVYNKSYDISTIMQRCQKNRIDTTHFSKSNKRPFMGGKEGINIDGVVIYDVLESSRADQSLTGNVENKGLKEVSNWFGFKEIRAPLTPREMTLLKGTDELKEYNKDDVRRLMLVFDIYWQSIEFNANDLKIPLNSAINLKTSDLGIIVIGDEHRALNVIADGTNAQRYPEIFQRKKKSGEKNYQGALVDIFVEPNYFEPVYKIDYSSLYPSIMATFNLSPDTTTLLEYAPYTGKFSMEDRGDWYMYSIPDDVLYYDIPRQIKKTNMIIQVSKKPGFSSTLVAKFLKEREEYKKLWKETDLPKYRAISDNRKVKANGGMYGSMGYSKHPFGFAPIAVATCGIGRECGQLLIDVLNELYPGCVLEVDSVTGDTPVFVKDKRTREIEIIPIEDLSDGSLRKFVNNYETLTRSGWKDLQYVYCHEVEKNICTIDMYGARIDVTEDHSLFSSGQKISPKNLVSGDVVDIYSPQDFGGSNNEINENQAWFLGFFLSDGTITIRDRNNNGWFTYELKISKQRLDLLEKAKNILKSDFGLESKIYDIRKSSSCYKVEVIGRGKKRKMEVDWIHNICYCKDGKTKKVPVSILNAPLSIVESFFQGLTDGDGSIAKDKKNEGKWSIDSIFKPLASGIAYLLDRRGITYNTFCRIDKPNITGICTHKPKEFCVKYVKKGNPGTVSKVMVEKRKQKVYDLSTEDGTFIAGIGRVICHNTDGVYFTVSKELFDEKKIVELYNEKLRKKFEREVALSIDFEEYAGGYFYKAKNYILKKTNGKKILHGVALKASSHTMLKKQLIGELSDAVINREPTDKIVRKYLNLNFPLKYFAMNVALGKRLHEYKNENTLVKRLAEMAKREYGIKPTVGNQYYYIKTKTDYKLFESATRDDLDYDYYRDDIKSVIDMFAIKNPSSGTLDKWI